MVNSLECLGIYYEKIGDFIGYQKSLPSNDICT